MLALDQRESLRGMFVDSLGRNGSDEELRHFKLTATRILSSAASGILLDKHFALDAPSLDAIASDCGLIVAADELIQESGQPVSTTRVDETVTTEFLLEVKASAIKFLVMWRGGSGKAERQRLIEPIVELARSAGVASLVEAVVLPDEGLHWDSFEAKNRAILDAAREMAAYSFDLYKAQVPGYIPGNLDGVEVASRELDSIVGCEWVVLSNGVERDDYPDAVIEACKGGASGFLAGRAIWADLVGVSSLEQNIENIARPRLEKLATLVSSM
jgi:sulfofructosephosphate aldolase